MLGELIDLVSGIAMASKATRRRTSLAAFTNISFYIICGMERLSNEVTCSGNGATSCERGTPVSYGYSFEDLLALLHGHAPAKVDAVALHRRRVEHCHLSVGLK